MTMGQDQTKEADDVALQKYYKQLSPRKDNFHDFYQLQNVVLGEGITGKVYKCIDKRTGTLYALKALQKTGKHVREVVLHRRMQGGCDYIVRIVDVFENQVKGQTILFVVMELMAGGELFNAISSRYQAQKPFSEREVAQLVLCVSKAVKHLHDHGIAHRDLKPENLLFSSKDPGAVIKLTDFGFAKESADSLKTPNFTPYYGAPEVLATRRNGHNGWVASTAASSPAKCYSLKCDTWSLGVIIYIMLSGYPPFYNSEGREKLTPNMQDKISQGDFKFPKHHGWGFVSNTAKNLIEKLLLVNVEERLSIDEALAHPWLRSHLSALSDQPLPYRLDSAHLDPFKWQHIINAVLEPPNVYRTHQRVVLRPVGLHPMYIKRQQAQQSNRKNSSNQHPDSCPSSPDSIGHDCIDAPEVIRSKGSNTHSYDKSCDCWSLGVIIYILLCGYPPFYSRHGHAMSPGMRDHIVQGKYRFPDREWSKISLEAKELIEKLLVVDPKHRYTIDDVMRTQWILSHRKLPELPLGSADVLNSEKPNWENMRINMSQQLESMRTNAQVTLNPVQRNELFKRRAKGGQGPEPIKESQTSVENAESPRPSSSGDRGAVGGQER